MTELESKGREIISILETGKPEDLLQHLSRGGLTVGIDALPTDPATIRKQFEDHKLLYCFFFNTDCYRREADAARKKAGAKPTDVALYSVRDIFRSHLQKQRILSGLRRQDTKWLGSISVVLNPDAKYKFDPSNVVALGFTKEASEWKLSFVDYNVF